MLRGKALVAYKQNLVLQPTQHHLIIGSILGDGCLRLPGRSHHANLTIEYGDEQKEYVKWKYERLREWVLTSPKQVSRSYHKDRTRHLVSWRFLTITHTALTYYYNLFYPNKTKIIPPYINELLTHPLALAVWLMDDGSKNKDVLFLNTQNFVKQEQELLQQCLWDIFQIDSTLNFHSYSKDKKLYRIRLTRNGSHKACQIVMRYVIPSLRYKFQLYPCND